MKPTREEIIRQKMFDAGVSCGNEDDFNLEAAVGVAMELVGGSITGWAYKSDLDMAVESPGWHVRVFTDTEVTLGQSESAIDEEVMERVYIVREKK